MTTKDILEFSIPLITFILGGVSTYIFTRSQAKKKRDRECIQEITKHANDWYHQLVELNSIKKQKIYNSKFEDYLLRQTALPYILKLSEILKGNKKYISFLNELEIYLNYVTRTENTDNNYIAYTENLLCKPITKDYLCDIEHASLKDTLDNLSFSLQKLNIEAGRLLKKL